MRSRSRPLFQAGSRRRPRRIRASSATVGRSSSGGMAYLASADFVAQMATLGALVLERRAWGSRRRRRAAPTPAHRAGGALEVEAAVVVDPARREGLDAVRRWYLQNRKALDQKLRSSMIEGPSVLLSVFELQDVAVVFCPPKPASPAGVAPPRDGPPAADCPPRSPGSSRGSTK